MSSSNPSSQLPAAAARPAAFQPAPVAPPTPVVPVATTLTLIPTPAISEAAALVPAASTSGQTTTSTSQPHHKAVAQPASGSIASKAQSALRRLSQPQLLAILGGSGVLVIGLGALLIAKLVGRKKSKKQLPKGIGRKGAAGNGDASSESGASVKAQSMAPGPWSKLKASSKCVPLADGSACVIRRQIAADNSCLFNAVGYGMHSGSMTRAMHLRNVVSREVSGDPEFYSAAFLGMPNGEYCRWIRTPSNWGGGIELSILAKAYGREIAAWNIESCQCHVFGEEQGYKHQTMVIYNGVHYDALAICNGPRAPQEEDVTDYNPRTKRGKMIIAAARKLTELTHRGSQYHGAVPAKVQCGQCHVMLTGKAEVDKHARATGHTQYKEAKEATVKGAKDSKGATAAQA